MNKLNHVGRKRIFVSDKFIDKTNLLQVLNKTFARHCANVDDMDFLIEYESGIHPFIENRKKEIRPEIDYHVVDNIAHYVTRFHIGYFWGTPATYIQRGNEEAHSTNPDVDDRGISALNEMMKNGNDIAYKRQQIAKYVEKTGIGHSIVEIKTKDEFGENPQITSKDGEYVDSLCHVYDLDSRFAYCVYHNGVGKKKVLGVTYSYIEDIIGESSGIIFTCYTPTMIYEVRNNEIVNPTPNPLGEIPIIEWNRDVDITGCFEHCIADMDALDVQASDMANNSTQRTQDVWWGHNIELPSDENGKAKAPESGEWVLTYSPQGMNERASDSKIQPLSSTYDGASEQNQLYRKYNHILQKCFVPIQSETTGGGSTGSAVDMSSGWSAAELDALNEQNVIELAAREELKLILKAISFVPTSILPEDAPIRKVHHTDIDIHFGRRRNYDLSVKANAFATLVGRGVHPRHALKVCEIFEDNEQVYKDSELMMNEYQKKVCILQPTESGEQATNPEKEMKADDRIMQDLSDQVSNSPRLQSGV